MFNKLLCAQNNPAKLAVDSKASVLWALPKAAKPKDKRCKEGSILDGTY
jgi:hypothetical protein